MQPSISDYYRQHILPKVRGEILRESNEQILGTDIDELKTYYYKKYAWSPIEEDPENEASCDVQDYLKTIPAHEREHFYSQGGDLRDFQCQRVVVEVPMLPNEHIGEIAELRGDTYSVSYSDSDFQWEKTRVVYTIETKGYGFTYDEDKIASEVEQALGCIRETIRFKNESIKKENAELLHAISQAVNERKQKIGENASKISELTKKISIPIKKKPVVGAQPVRSVQKPPVQHTKPKLVQKEEKKYDFFISYATEDKDYVDELAKRLKNEGFEIWYDTFEINWGDDLRTSIDQGLKNSRFGIVILSKSFLGKKKWADYELNGLFALEKNSVKVILPVWHNIKREDVLVYSPTLADKVAKSSDDMDDIVDGLKKIAKK